MVRYVHLPGGAVDTALLEDGLYPASAFLDTVTDLFYSYPERSCKSSYESEMIQFIIRCMLG